MFPVPLNSSNSRSSMREPVSTSAVDKMVSEPPNSTLRAAPRNLRGGCRAEAATPPARVLLLAGAARL